MFHTVDVAQGAEHRHNHKKALAYKESHENCREKNIVEYDVSDAKQAGYVQPLHCKEGMNL